MTTDRPKEAAVADPTRTAALHWDCPFCSGRFGYSDEPQGVLHSIPYCAKFEVEEPLMYLRNARVAMVGRLPDDDEWPVPGSDGGAQ